MSRRKSIHIKGIEGQLMAYCKDRLLDFHQYNPYHMRIMDGGYNVLDVWTTGRYYILTTDYLGLDIQKTERGGEKGMIPHDLDELHKWLDKLFFPEGVEV